MSSDERCISCGSIKGHKQGCNPDDPAQARRNAAAREVLERLTAGLCIQCGATITDVYQVGQSIYNRPCGHRQGMGKAAEYRKGVLAPGHGESSGVSQGRASARGGVPMTRYAESTSVSSDKSRAEIERTLERYGATKFMYGWEEDRAIIGFEMKGRRVRFILPLPDKNDREFIYHSRGRRTTEAALKAWEQATRQRWRALTLVVKAKLEAVEAGITTFEDEFLAHIVLPDGRSVGQWAGPQLASAYDTGRMPPMLPLLPDRESE